jgi:hypothetical protein
VKIGKVAVIILIDGEFSFATPESRCGRPSPYGHKACDWLMIARDHHLITLTHLLHKFWQ